jgi:uncharacterized protein YjeT (DUF2065 family)
MADVFVVASAVVFVISGTWFLIWPQWLVEAIRGDFVSR